MSASKNKRKPPCVLLRLSTFYLCVGTEVAVWDFSHLFWKQKALMKSFKWRRCTCGTGSQVRVQGVRGQTDAGSMDSGQDACVCVCPFMVFLTKTVAGHVALMSSDPSGFGEIGLWFVVGKFKKNMFGSSRGSPNLTHCRDWFILIYTDLYCTLQLQIHIQAIVPVCGY